MSSLMPRHRKPDQNQDIEDDEVDLDEMLLDETMWVWHMNTFNDFQHSKERQKRQKSEYSSK